MIAGSAESMEFSRHKSDEGSSRSRIYDTVRCVRLSDRLLAWKRIIYIPLSRSVFSTYKAIRPLVGPAYAMQDSIWKTPITKQPRVRMRDQQSTTNSRVVDSWELDRQRWQSPGWRQP